MGSLSGGRALHLRVWQRLHVEALWKGPQPLRAHRQQAVLAGGLGGRRQRRERDGLGRRHLLKADDHARLQPAGEGERQQRQTRSRSL